MRSFRRGAQLELFNSKNMWYYTYVLFDRKLKKFYIGYTNDIKRRLKEHHSKKTKTTAFMDPVLVYYEACLNPHDARVRETQLKTGFGRDYLKRRIGTYLKDIFMRA